jgi:hypothetical protein
MICNFYQWMYLPCVLRMTINRLSSLSREKGNPVCMFRITHFYSPRFFPGAGEADTGRLHSLQVNGSAQDDAGRCGIQNAAMNAAGGVIHKQVAISRL